MLADVDRRYASENLPFRTRLFPIVYALHRDGPQSVGDLAALSGFSQPAVSQTLRQLERDGHIAVTPGRDARNRVVALTPAGNALVASLQPFWQRARQAVEQLLAEAAPGFLQDLGRLEAALEHRSLFDRIENQPAAAGGVEILPFDETCAAAFRDLNLEWLEAYFQVEEYDREQLDNPARILEAGGEIWFARADGVMVGTGALYCHGDGDYEIAKMAVTEKVRGRGIGRLLLAQLVERYRQRGGRRLHLVTNNGLAAAIALYRSVGFVEYTPDAPSRYARGNFFMEWHGDSR